MNETARVLLVDDEENFRLVAGNELTRAGFEVQTTSEGEKALGMIPAFKPEVILIDLQMPGMNGIELLRRLEESPDDAPEAIVITGHSAVDSAVEAMKHGAVDYITKPFNLDELKVVIERAHERWKLKRQNRMFRKELGGRDERFEFVGQSPAVKRLWEIISRVGPSDAATLVQGESGSGKELISRAVHKLSPRAEEPFIVVDCCSLQPALLENELFGHEAGAYTGATRMKHGLFEVADRGTIFMDEIGEISLEIQAKLLRVLENGTFRRVGSTNNIGVNVRLIAATNRNLRQLIEEGKFREDLYYRLNIIAISVPPLRERKEDVPILIDHFLKTSHLPKAAGKKVPKHVVDYLVDYEWWGNVRELKNAVKRAVILSDSDELTVEDFHLPVRHSNARKTPGSENVAKEWRTLSEMEMEHIRKVLAATNGHRRKAAEILGVSERCLYRKIKGMAETEE